MAAELRRRFQERAGIPLPARHGEVDAFVQAVLAAHPPNGGAPNAAPAETAMTATPAARDTPAPSQAFRGSHQGVPLPGYHAAQHAFVQAALAAHPLPDAGTEHAAPAIAATQTTSAVPRAANAPAAPESAPAHTSRRNRTAELQRRFQEEHGFSLPTSFAEVDAFVQAALAAHPPSDAAPAAPIPQARDALPAEGLLGGIGNADVPNGFDADVWATLPPEMREWALGGSTPVANRGTRVRDEGASETASVSASTSSGTMAAPVLSASLDPAAIPTIDAARAHQLSDTSAVSSSSCVICMQAPAVATFIHGDTGHTACCMPCAEELRRRPRGQRCPVCRVPFTTIIRNFAA